MTAEDGLGGDAEGLRRTLRDLVAISMLAPTWATSPPRTIAESFVDTLTHLFPLEIAFVELNEPHGRECIRVGRHRDQSLEPGQEQLLEATLKQYSNAENRGPRLIPHPLSDGNLHAEVMNFGLSQGLGALVVGSRSPDFPNESDQLLLTVACNQVAFVMQSRWAEDERERLFREVETERERLAEIFQRAPSFMCILRGPDHVFERANDFYYQVIGHREILGKPAREALPEIEGQGFFELLDQVYTTGEPFVGRDVPVALQRQPDAPLEVRHIDFVYQALRDPDGSVSGVFAQGVDLTERHEAEAALREADRQKDDFLAALAHELRNPLASIASAGDLMSMDGPVPSDIIEEGTDVIVRQAGHMKRLLDDLLDVARITRGQVTLLKEPLAVTKIMEQAVEMARPGIVERRHNLTVDFPEAPVWIEGDLTRLAQVISNLLTNAAKYTPEGGQIVLSAQVSKDTMAFSVRDNGIGIAPEMMPSLFRLASRAHGTGSDGLGIGLPLVKSLVELHGGEVEAHSQGPGRGSEFIVRLPRLASFPASNAPPSAAANSTQDPGLRVLLVEDNADLARLTARMLIRAGLDVQTAQDGRHALETARLIRPDVIVMDIGLPDMSGLELAALLREREETVESRIIAVSGYGQPEDVQRSKDAGCDDHLVKPVKLQELLTAIARTT